MSKKSSSSASPASTTFENVAFSQITQHVAKSREDVMKVAEIDVKNRGSYCFCAAWANIHPWLATAHNGYSAAVWHTETWKLERDFQRTMAKRESGSLVPCAFNDDDSRFVCAGGVRVLTVRDTTTADWRIVGERTFSNTEGQQIYSVAFEPSQASGSSSAAASASSSPPQQRLLVTGNFQNNLAAFILNVASEKLETITTIPLADGASGVGIQASWDPSGKSVFVAAGTTIKQHDATTASELREFDCAAKALPEARRWWGAAVSPNGKHLVALSSNDDVIAVIDVETNTLRGTFAGADTSANRHSPNFYASFTSDSSHVVIACSGGWLRICNLEQCVAVGKSLKCDNANAYGCAIAPPSRHVDGVVATCGYEKVVRVWAMPALQTRWKRRVIVLRIAKFGQCRLAKFALDQWVTCRLVAMFL